MQLQVQVSIPQFKKDLLANTEIFRFAQDDKLYLFMVINFVEHGYVYNFVMQSAARILCHAERSEASLY
jgi:hypothetical protein